MPIASNVIDKLLESPREAKDLESYRAATLPWPVVVPDDMALALGSAFARRRLTPFAGVAVDVVSAKLEIDRDAIKLAGATETKAVKGWLSDERFAATERELWKTVARDGKAFLLVNWRGVDQSNLDYQEAHPCFEVVPAYDGRRGAGCYRDPMLGAVAMCFNYWDDDAAEYFDCYFSDRVEKYWRQKTDTQAGRKDWAARVDAEGESWPTPWTQEDGSPLGIALMEFRIDGSVIADAIQLSKDLNEAVLDMLAASRTQGWPQRYIKGSRNSDVVTNGLGQPVISMHTGRPIKKTVSLAPGSILSLAENSEMGQLAAAAPDRTLVDTLLELLSFVTTVPTHYFTGQWPSGAALSQAESRMNHRVEEYQSLLSQPAAAAISLAMRLSNKFAGTRLKAQQRIDVPWETPEVETDEVRFAREQAGRDHATDLFQAGLMTLRTALKTIHPDWDEAEIEAEAAELEKAKDAAHEQAMALKAGQPDVPNGDGLGVAGSKSPDQNQGQPTS